MSDEALEWSRKNRVDLDAPLNGAELLEILRWWLEAYDRKPRPANYIMGRPDKLAHKVRRYLEDESVPDSEYVRRAKDVR